MSEDKKLTSEKGVKYAGNSAAGFMAAQIKQRYTKGKSVLLYGFSLFWFF